MSFPLLLNDAVWTYAYANLHVFCDTKNINKNRNEKNLFYGYNVATFVYQTNKEQHHAYE